MEDETGTVNLIVPPKVYERDRLVVRAEPLVVAEGVLERHASAGGAINVVCRRLARLDASGHLQARPAADVASTTSPRSPAASSGPARVIQVKDFAMLDALELPARRRGGAAAEEGEDAGGDRAPGTSARSRRRPELRVGTAAMSGSTRSPAARSGQGQDLRWGPGHRVGSRT